MAKQVKGRCRCCSKEYARAGMLKHLSVCAERGAEADKETGRSTGYFELLITAKYRKNYWLVIEMEETEKLKDLDQFIRDIWVECCGHLSSFNIDGQRYDLEAFSDSFWDLRSENMDIQLKKVLRVGLQFEYEYDFGSPTELIISVVDYRKGKQKKKPITILSRNNPPEILCSICGENNANWVSPEGFYDGTPYWCEECVSAEEAEDGDYPEFLLPVCNSPRMGVCGYGRSSDYEEES